jgi:hypothetical protein
MSEKTALTDYPLHEFLTERWGSYAFQDCPVRQAALHNCGWVRVLD